MNIQDQYNSLLSMFKPHLKLLGFKYKKPMFYIKHRDNYGMIVFQKSMTSTHNEISFTINIGVSSKAIFDFNQSNLLEFKPSFTHACWTERIGFLTEKKIDIWWILNGSTNLDSLFTELQTYIINLAVPEINKYIDDASLIEKCSNSTSPYNLIYLAVLLKSAGRLAELEPVIHQLDELNQSAKYKAATNFALKYLRSN